MHERTSFRQSDFVWSTENCRMWNGMDSISSVLLALLLLLSRSVSVFIRLQEAAVAGAPTNMTYWWVHLLFLSHTNAYKWLPMQFKSGCAVCAVRRSDAKFPPFFSTLSRWWCFHSPYRIHTRARRNSILDFQVENWNYEWMVCAHPATSMLDAVRQRTHMLIIIQLFIVLFVLVNSSVEVATRNKEVISATTQLRSEVLWCGRCAAPWRARMRTFKAVQNIW